MKLIPPLPHGTEPQYADPILAPEDFYCEGLCIVFTAAYHLKRGFCCASGCRHCPWQDLLDA